MCELLLTICYFFLQSLSWRRGSTLGWERNRLDDLAEDHTLTSADLLQWLRDLSCSLSPSLWDQQQPQKIFITGKRRPGLTFFFFFILFAFTLFDWNDYRGSKSKYNKVKSFMFFSWVCEYIHINQIIYIYLTRISWCHENSFHNQNIYRLFFSFFCFISKYSLSFELNTWFTAECSRYVTSSSSVKN